LGEFGLFDIIWNDDKSESAGGSSRVHYTTDKHALSSFLVVVVDKSNCG